MAIFPRNQPQGPQNTVLSIPELVELILLNTDTITVLVSAQRVNKQWHDIIASSRRLQGHLFFRPAQKGPLQEPTNTNTATDQAHNSIPNPLIPKICMAIAYQPKAQVGIIFHHQKLPQVNKPACRRRDASWRRMLLRQPPSRRIGVVPRTYTGIVARIPVRAKGDNDELRGEDLAGLVLIKQATIMSSEDMRIRVQHSKHVTDEGGGFAAYLRAIENSGLSTCDVVLAANSYIHPRSWLSGEVLSEPVWVPCRYEMDWLKEQCARVEMKGFGPPIRSTESIVFLAFESEEARQKLLGPGG